MTSSSNGSGSSGQVPHQRPPGHGELTAFESSSEVRESRTHSSHPQPGASPRAERRRGGTRHLESTSPGREGTSFSRRCRSTMPTSHSAFVTPMNVAQSAQPATALGAARSRPLLARRDAPAVIQEEESGRPAAGSVMKAACRTRQKMCSASVYDVLMYLCIDVCVMYKPDADEEHRV